MKIDKMRPGPKPKTLTEGVIEGIPCGWNKTVIPPDQVYELAVLGLNNKEIGRFYNVSDATISRNFVAELQKGREMTKIKLRRAMFHNATVNHNAAVQIFLAKAMLGMNETQPAEAQPLPWIENEKDSELPPNSFSEDETTQD